MCVYVSCCCAEANALNFGNGLQTRAHTQPGENCSPFYFIARHTKQAHFGCLRNYSASAKGCGPFLVLFNSSAKRGRMKMMISLVWRVQRPIWLKAVVIMVEIYASLRLLQCADNGRKLIKVMRVVWLLIWALQCCRVNSTLDITQFTLNSGELWTTIIICDTYIFIKLVFYSKRVTSKFRNSRYQSGSDRGERVGVLGREGGRV